jgi:hypothetical protein
MRYCIINYKQNAEKYFKETAYDRESWCLLFLM